jgi:probable rRNA maturation factor
MIFTTNNHPSLRFPKRETLRAIQSVLKDESAPSFRLSVVFVGSRTIRTMNRRFLGHDYVTDVIAFPLGEDDEPGAQAEVYVNLDRAKSQAREYGVTFAEETRRLLIHGALHVMGYSDATPGTKAAMTRRENEHLARLSKKSK